MVTLLRGERDSQRISGPPGLGRQGNTTAGVLAAGAAATGQAPNFSNKRGGGSANGMQCPLRPNALVFGFASQNPPPLHSSHSHPSDLYSPPLPGRLQPFRARKGAGQGAQKWWPIEEKSRGFVSRIPRQSARLLFSSQMPAASYTQQMRQRDVREAPAFQKGDASSLLSRGRGRPSWEATFSSRSLQVEQGTPAKAMHSSLCRKNSGIRRRFSEPRILALTYDLASTTQI